MGLEAAFVGLLWTGPGPRGTESRVLIVPHHLGPGMAPLWLREKGRSGMATFGSGLAWGGVPGARGGWRSGGQPCPHSFVDGLSLLPGAVVYGRASREKRVGLALKPG